MIAGKEIGTCSAKSISFFFGRKLIQSEFKLNILDYRLVE